MDNLLDVHTKARKPQLPIDTAAAGKFSWLILTPEQRSVDYCTRYDPQAASSDLPVISILDEHANRTFWSHCARASIVFYLNAIANNDSTQAFHFRRMFLLAMTNRRTMRYFRIVKRDSYKELRAVFNLAKGLVLDDSANVDLPGRFSPLLKTVNQWADRFIDQKPHDLSLSEFKTDRLDQCYLEIIHCLEGCNQRMSPTDGARYLTQICSENFSPHASPVIAQGDHYQKIHDLNKMLAPYLFDVRYFKKKHRNDAILLD